MRKAGNMNSPCLKCPDRREGCHGSCERYAKYVGRRRAIAQAKAKWYADVGAAVESVLRNKKRHEK